MIYGYARVSTAGQGTHGNGLESQVQQLREAGAVEIITDTFTGTKMERPGFAGLMERLTAGDELKVCKLDRFARNAADGAKCIQSLIERGVRVHILNMGTADNSPMGKLMVNIMLAFAEFERDQIVERTQTGKAIAKQRAGFREGRPAKYTEREIDAALEMLKERSYSEVVKLTGISKSTLVRAARKQYDSAHTSK